MHVNDFDIEMAPAPHMVFFDYEDRPGVIGTVGTILGERRDQHRDDGRRSSPRGGMALMGLTVDSPAGQDVIDEITSAIGGRAARSIVLPD